LKAVILAAGEGSRMRPLTYSRPKVMVSVANKPILEHLLDEARQAGITEFIFIVGYCDEQVRGYFGSGEKWGVNITYRNQRKQLGTADAIRAVENMVDGSFLVINGDILVSHDDISKVAGNDSATISVVKVERTAGLGMVEMEEGKVVRIYEKTVRSPGTMANAGMYLFTPDIFAAIADTPKSPRGEYEITDSLQLMIDQSQEGVVCQEISHWMDVSYPWDLLSLNESLLSRIEGQNLGEIETNAVIKGVVAIGRNTVVRSGAYIVGPVAIGSDCEIGPNCYIRPGTSIGDNCHIGSAVEVKNSIIMKGSKFPHHNYVGDSVIGENCNFGAGTKIANLRLDGKEISVINQKTGRRKLGAIVGDGVETGINASINLGCLIGNDTHIGPGAVVSGVILPGSKIY